MDILLVIILVLISWSLGVTVGYFYGKAKTHIVQETKVSNIEQKEKGDFFAQTDSKVIQIVSNTEKQESISDIIIQLDEIRSGKWTFERDKKTTPEELPAQNIDGQPKIDDEKGLGKDLKQSSGTIKSYDNIDINDLVEGNRLFDEKL